jgi:hypothetical protein
MRAVLLLLLAACGGAPIAPAPAPATPPAPTPAAVATPRDLPAEHKAAYARATRLALKRDFDAAVRELEPFARDTASRADLPLAYWIHNQLTWLRWGRGDLRGALAETEQGGTALDRSTLGADEIASMRLHALWDRAYLLLELGDAKADRAFSDYEALAKARSDHDGLAVLTAFFAARRGKGQEAMTAAKRVDVEKDDDLQDLYVIALAFDAGGDPKTARAVRERICRGHEYLMKPLIVAQMAREAFTCR